MRESLSRFLSNTPAFGLSLALFAAVTVLSGYACWPDLRTASHLALGRTDERAELWRSWAEHNSGLFGMLYVPARIGIQERGQRASGVLLEKTASGFRAETKLWLSAAKPHLVFLVDQTAERRLLEKFQLRSPGDIWQVVKEQLYGDHLKIWHDPDLEALHRGGYLLLMRAIDTRPEPMPWGAVKNKLDEPLK